MVNGPHCNCTSAITPSTVTSVTRPTIRLRAELAMPSGSGGAAAWSRANSASCSPAMTLRPASSFSAVRAPASIQRRTVSSLTPSSAAASLIRSVVNSRSSQMYPQILLYHRNLSANADHVGAAGMIGTGH